MRYMYWERLKAHPLRFLEFYASMPAEVIRTLASPFTRAPTLAGLWLVAAAGPGVFIILLGLARSEDIGDGVRASWRQRGGNRHGDIANMISYVAAYSMADSILMVMALTAAAIGIGAYAVLRNWPRPIRE